MAAPPDTTPVRKEHTFDVESLARYLARQGQGFGDKIETLLQFNAGQSNPTFYFKDNKGGEYVLRKKPPGKLLPSAHAIEREYRIIRALRTTGFPVPEAVLLCEDASVIGTPFYVMKFIKGRILKDALLSDMQPSERRAIYEAMNDTLARLHSINYKSIGLADFGNTGNYFQRQISRWTRQYESSKTKEIDSMERLIQWLPNNIPPDDDIAIVHGDYRLENIMFHPTEPRVVAVLDWELSTLGHPLADLGYNCMPYYMPRLPVPVTTGFGDIDFKAHGIPTYKEYVESYCKKRGIPPVKDMTFYSAFSLFRMAAILQGVYKRALQGNASSDRARIVGGAAQIMADCAWDLVCKNQRSIQLFPFSAKSIELKERLLAFMDEYIYPNEKVYAEEIKQNRWAQPKIMEFLKQKAREHGLWNLFLPGEQGAGLSNLDYAPLAEIMGRSPIAPEAFNCNAPDTGNMEVLHKYGTPEQKSQWLVPLLRGEIRSAFAMTEPDQASSDATNISTRIERDGDYYVINGKKWWTSGAAHPNCKVFILMGKSQPQASVYRQQSMIIVPADTPGVKIVRPLSVFGYYDEPFGHCEVHFENVRVPAKNLLLGEGIGFEIAQGRLGPGRIHHCMRLIGLAERCLEIMIQRIHTRTTFKKKLAEHGMIQHWVAQSRVEIEQARLLTLKAAHAMDVVGNRVARDLIAMIKVVAPSMACRVIDRAIQACGAAGLSEDFPLARAYMGARSLRIADGPDEVHELTIAKLEYEKQLAKRSKL